MGSACEGLGDGQLKSDPSHDERERIKVVHQ
jgi:hypothetical protein